MLGWIDAPHFFAGFVMQDDVVTEAAPIIKYTVGWTRNMVRAYVVKKHWKAGVMKDPLQ